MSSSAVTPPLPAFRSRVQLLALVSSLATLVGCTQPLTPPTEEERVSASFSIQDADLLASSTGDQDRRLALGVRSQAFSLADVQAIKVNVQDAVTQNFILVNVDLNKAEAPATGWIGEIPSLPKGKALRFSTAAYSSKTVQPAHLLFSGTTTQTLTSPHQTVFIALVPANDGKDVLLPRIARIAIPSAFVSHQPNNISFVVEGANGATLSYVVKAAGTDGSGGVFYPATGALTLSATAGTFVSQYEPPLVSADTTFEHSVTVTNAVGHSVTTTFKTNVKPPGSTDSVTKTRVSVLFNPVINALNGRRVGSTSDVLFTADVADNSPENQLVYTWSFSSTGTYNPLPTMDGITRTGTLRNYTKDVQGTVSVAVKDPDNGTTTLKYNLTPNQFPDNPYVEGDANGMNSIRAGEGHTCALFNNGDLRCWGLNANGQLGYGNTLDTGGTPDTLPYKSGRVPFVGKGARFATGARHTCVLLNDGHVSCWGKNEFGQLGYNTTDNVGGSRPVAEYGYVNLGGAATKITAGENHTCALMATGNVRCWGYNVFGQLGNGDTNNIGDDEFPTLDVQVGAPVLDVVAGAYHTCALLNTNAVRCWGLNSVGQLGTGNSIFYGSSGANPAAAAPVVALGGGRVLQLGAGSLHTCAVLDTGSVRCWGYNVQGQLGNGSSTTVFTSPTSDIHTGGKVLQVAGGARHTCVLLESGTIKCWGYNSEGQLGLGSTAGQSTPTAAVNLNGATAFQITTGANHTCALLSTGKARCWGANASGQLGYGHKNSLADGSSAGDVPIATP